MDYRELDTNDYEVAIGEKSPNGIQQITITVKRDAPFCEECLSVEAVKKCIASRKVLDVVDKQPVHYIINRYRYRCLECGRTFVNETLYEPKVRVAPEFGDYIAQRILQDDLTEKEAAKKYGVSTTYISQAMHAYRQEFEEGILSIAACSVLVFYPFEYSSRTRCCVIGTDRYGRNVLVGILTDCSDSTIYQFVHEKIKYTDELKTVYCDVNPHVYKYLSASFPKADIRIINDSLIKFCALFNKDTGDGFFNEKNNHAKKFNAIVRSASTSALPLGQALRNWWQEAPECIREHFALMWTYVEACMDGCRNEPMPEGLKASVDTTLEIIKRFRKDNVQFDIMILRTLFKDEAVIRQVKHTPYGNYMSMTYVLSGKSDYEVDIARLEQIYLK